MARCRNGVWWTDFRYQDPQGRRLRCQKSLGPEVATEAEAERLERHMRADLERGGAPAVTEAPRPTSSPSVAAPPRPTTPTNEGLPAAAFSGYARVWLNAKRPPIVSAKQWALSESILTHHLIPALGKQQLAAITRADVKALQRKLLDTPKQRGAGKLSPKTVNTIVALLGTILRDAIEDGYLRENVAAGLRPVKVQRPSFAFYTAEQTEVFLRACVEEAPAWFPFYLLAFRAGMRMGEILALRVEDLDLNRASVTVERSYGGAYEPDEDDAPRRVYQEGPTKGRAVRHIGLTADVVDVLRVFVGRRKSGLLFCRPGDFEDTHYSIRQVERPFHRVIKATDLPRLRLHDIRHSFASQLVMAGVPLRQVQELCGHSTIEVTERYAHLAPGSAVRAVDALIGGRAPASPRSGDTAGDIAGVAPGKAGATPGSVVGVTGFEARPSAVESWLASPVIGLHGDDPLIASRAVERTEGKRLVRSW